MLSFLKSSLSLLARNLLGEALVGQGVLRPAVVGWSRSETETLLSPSCLWFAAPKKRVVFFEFCLNFSGVLVQVSLHKRKQRWLNKWLVPVRQIAVCQ